MDKVDPVKVATWSKYLRAADGLTQRALAERVKCKHGVICLMEQGMVRSQAAARRLLALQPQNDAI